MDATFTASGLAAQLAQLNLGDEAELMRTVRHYTAEGLLKPLGAVNTGTGRKRTYPRDALLKAVILVRLHRLGIPVGIIRELVRGLTASTAGELSADLVEAVKTKLKRPCLVLPITTDRSSYEPPRLMEAREAYRGGGEDVIILDLSRYRPHV